MSRATQSLSNAGQVVHDACAAGEVPGAWVDQMGHWYVPDELAANLQRAMEATAVRVLAQWKSIPPVGAS